MSACSSWQLGIYTPSLQWYCDAWPVVYRDSTVLRLLDFPLKDTLGVSRVRNKFSKFPQDETTRVNLGIVLAKSGCSYEAAYLLRPMRPHWKASADAPLVKATLQIQTWWNQNWKYFVQLKRSGDGHAALQLLGDRLLHFWDQPALLIHLGDVAADENQLELSDHLYQRVFELSRQGLPKMNMQAFEYVSQAGIVENLQRRGDVKEALRLHLATTPNQGNAMSCEMQRIRLLTIDGQHDEAMALIVSMMATAKNKRSGYSQTMRTDFVDQATELKPLRKRADWGKWE